MIMTTRRLLLLRLYNISFGRFSLGSRLLRWVLVHILIKKSAKGGAYMASSRFFLLQELE